MAGQLAEEFASVFDLPDLTTTPRHAGRTCHTTGFNTLAIGRIHQHHRRHITGRHALQGVTTTQVHSLGHTGAFGVALRKVDHAKR
jgi:hypothetical protein